MEDLECPHCHNKSISVWTKLFTGPGRTVACPNCQGKVSVPASSIWVAIPAIAGAVAAIFVDSRMTGAVLFVAGTIVTTFLHYKFVPLIAR
jgi:hypothetical protein